MAQAEGIRTPLGTYSSLSKYVSEKKIYLHYFTFGDGTTEYVDMTLSGNSSRILEIRRVPIPDPVSYYILTRLKSDPRVII